MLLLAGRLAVGASNRRAMGEVVGPVQHRQALKPVALGWLEGSARDKHMTGQGGLAAELRRLLVTYGCILLVLRPWVLADAACSVGGPTLPYRSWTQVLVDIMMGVLSVVCH